MYIDILHFRFIINIQYQLDLVQKYYKGTGYRLCSLGTWIVLGTLGQSYHQSLCAEGFNILIFKEDFEGDIEREVEKAREGVARGASSQKGKEHVYRDVSLMKVTLKSSHFYCVVRLTFIIHKTETGKLLMCRIITIEC